MRSFAFVLLLLSACTREVPAPGVAGPDEAVRSFATALQRGDADAAWALLSRRTQAEADRLAAAAQKATDAGAGSGRQMLLSSALPAGLVSARVVRQAGDEADVEAVPDAGPGRTFRAVREGGVWRVDLPLGP